MSTYGGEPVLRSKAIVDEEESGRRRRKEESIALENIRGFNGFYMIQDEFTAGIMVVQPEGKPGGL